MKTRIAIAIFLTLILIGLPLGVTHGASPAPGRVDATMDTGRSLLQQGDIKGALQEFEKVISVDGGNGEALYYAATIYLRMNQVPKGISYLERSVAAAPNNVRLRLILARTYENAQLYDRALAEYRKIQEMKADPAESREAHRQERIILGKIYGRAGDFDRALQEFDSVLEDFPDDVSVLQDKGLTLMFMRRFDQAREAMESAAALQPQNGLIRRYLAEIAEKEGKLEESVRQYQRALQLAPKGSPVVRLIEGKLAAVQAAQYLEQGKLNDARREYEKVLEANPKDKTARFNLAKIYHDSGDLPKAERMLVLLFEDNPSDLGIELRLGTLYLEQGDVEAAAQRLNDVVAKGGEGPEAKQARQLLAGLRSAAQQGAGPLNNDDRIALYRAMLEANPDDRKSWMDLGLLYIELGRRKEAADALEHVVSLQGDDAGAQTVLGRLYDEMGDLDKAQKALSRALELEDAPAQKKKLAEQIALIFAKKTYNVGNLEGAETEFSQIAELNPDSYIAHFFLALIYSRTDKLDQAEKEYKEVLRVVPGHALARLSLGAIHEQTGHEEEAAEDYRAVVISRAAGLSDAAEDRLAQLQKRLAGFTFDAGYTLNFDSNSNLSPTAPAQELRSDAAGTISYQRKVKGRRLFWGVKLSPTYSIYHQQQFDFLSMGVSPFLNGVWRDFNWSANYGFNQTDGVLVEQHYNSSNSLYADVLKRFKMRPLLPFLFDGEQGSVTSAWRINGAYRTFRSTTSPIYDANIFSLGALLSQAGAGGWSWTGVYNFTNNVNVSAIGSDFAYSAHGINLQLSKSISPKVTANGGYGFTYSRYTHPDSVTRFTKFRVNTFHSLFFGANYIINDRLRFYGSLSYQRNNSNLPTGFILSAEDVGTAVGIQSPSLGNYNKYGITMGMALNF